MKKITLFLTVFCAVWVLSEPSATRAQRPIQINSVSGTQFCAGDPISVTFTAYNTWEPTNVFILQLSNDSGTFDQGFQNIGTIQDTAPGTFTIVSTIPIGSNKYHELSIRKLNGLKDSTYYSDTVEEVIMQGGGGTWDTIYMKESIRHTIGVPASWYDTVSLPAHYRVRILGTNHYTESLDNGTDLVINPAADLFYFTSKLEIVTDSILVSATAVGINKLFQVTSNTNTDAFTYDSLYWTFGDGASPSTAQTYSNYVDGNVIVTYSTSGLKTVTVTSVAPGGCSISDTTYVRVFDCSTPVIPSNAIVISHDTTLDAWDDSLGYSYRNPYDTSQIYHLNPASFHPRTFWINPGVTVTTNPGWYANQGHNDFDTIFAESGANINCDEGALIYLKPGATVTNPSGLVIYSNGASILGSVNGPMLECDSLTFDYTAAPPNSIMHVNEAVATAVPSEPITISPNPTNGIVMLQNIPLGANVSVMNVLGQTVQTENAKGNSNLSFDLSNFTTGTYYIRIASGNSVTTKSIVKE